MSQNVFNLIIFLFLINMFAFIWCSVISGIHRRNLKYKFLDLKENLIDSYNDKKISKEVFSFIEDYIGTIAKRSKNLSFLHIIWFNIFTSKVLAKRNKLPSIEEILKKFDDKEKAYIQEELNKISVYVLEYMVYKSFFLFIVLIVLSIFELIGAVSKSKIEKEVSSKIIYKNIILETSSL